MENLTGIEGEDEMLAAFCQSPPAGSRRSCLALQAKATARRVSGRYRVAEVAGMFLFSLYLTPLQCCTVRSPVRFETLVSRVVRMYDDCHVYIHICLVVINMYGTSQRYIVVRRNLNSAPACSAPSAPFRFLRCLRYPRYPPLPSLRKRR